MNTLTLFDLLFIVGALSLAVAILWAVADSRPSPRRAPKEKARMMREEWER